MSSSHRALKLFGLLAAIGLLAGLVAGPASAKRLSAKQKSAIRAQLRKQVKKNPRAIMKRGFLKKASLVEFKLPTTIRLNPATDQNGHYATTDDAALLDLGGSLGKRSVALGGKIKAVIEFADVYDGGNLGDVKLTLLNGGSLHSTSVPLLSNSATTTSPRLGGTGCATNPTLAGFGVSGSGFESGTYQTGLGAFGAFGAHPVWAGASLPRWNGTDFTATSNWGGYFGDHGTFDTGVDGLTNIADTATKPASAGDPDGAYNGTAAGAENYSGTSGDSFDVNSLASGNAALMPSGGLRDVVLRTAPLDLQVVPSGTQTSLGRTGQNGGKANLFGNLPNKSVGVDVTVSLGTEINSIVRQVDGSQPTAIPTNIPASGSGANPGVVPTFDGSSNIGALFNCRQAWTGKVQNYLQDVKLQGSLKISPAITADGKLRIAKVNLSTPTGQESKIALAACLVPQKTFADFTGTPTTYPYIDPATVASTPTEKCNAGGGVIHSPPFNVSTLSGDFDGADNIVGTTDDADNGAVAKVSGDLKVSSLTAEVLVGDH